MRASQIFSENIPRDELEEVIDACLMMQSTTVQQNIEGPIEAERWDPSFIQKLVKLFVDGDRLSDRFFQQERLIELIDKVKNNFFDKRMADTLERLLQKSRDIQGSGNASIMLLVMMILKISYLDENTDSDGISVGFKFMCQDLSEKLSKRNDSIEELLQQKLADSLLRHEGKIRSNHNVSSSHSSSSGSKRKREDESQSIDSIERIIEKKSKALLRAIHNEDYDTIQNFLKDKRMVQIISPNRAGPKILNEILASKNREILKLFFSHSFVFAVFKLLVLRGATSENKVALVEILLQRFAFEKTLLDSALEDRIRCGVKSPEEVMPTIKAIWNNAKVKLMDLERIKIELNHQRAIIRDFEAFNHRAISSELLGDAPMVVALNQLPEQNMIPDPIKRSANEDDIDALINAMLGIKIEESNQSSSSNIDSIEEKLEECCDAAQKTLTTLFDIDTARNTMQVDKKGKEKEEEEDEMQPEYDSMTLG